MAVTPTATNIIVARNTWIRYLFPSREREGALNKFSLSPGTPFQPSIDDSAEKVTEGLSVANIMEVEVEEAKTLFAAVAGPPTSVKVWLAWFPADDGALDLVKQSSKVDVLKVVDNDETVAGEALVLNDEGAFVAIDKDMEKLEGSGASNPLKRNLKKLKLYNM